MSKQKLSNPFPGLRPFEAHENHLFFGRDGQSDELLRRLGQNRFLAVVGTSGSGKSSLVRAGLLPILHGGFMEGGSSHWRVAVFRPGADPIGNLAVALSQPGLLGEDNVSEGDNPVPVQTAITEATLRRGSPGLVEVVRQARLPGSENLLLVVDQFEELFRFKDSAQVETAGDEAAAFVKLLLKAVSQVEISIYIAITMRSDFLGDCARFRNLPEAINDSQYLIPRMTRDQRGEAITGPVAVGGAEISSRLKQRLLNDVGDNPDQLPILQHALMRTWDYWQDNGKQGEPLDVVHYETIGGMAEALNRHADEAFVELDQCRPEDGGQRCRELAEKLFRSITELGHDNREVRRPTLLKEVCRIAGAGVEEMKPVIDIFRSKGRSFLMPPKGTDLHGESLIDISHESLIRQWKRLREWVIKEAEDREMYERIAGAAQRYEENKGGLLHDPDLQFALEWQEKSYNQAWALRCLPDFKLDKALVFLEKSKKKRDDDIKKEKERQKRELKRTRTFTAILSAALIIAIFVGYFAWQQRNEAEKQSKLAEARRELALKKGKEAEEQSKLAMKKSEEAEKERDEARKQREEAETQRNKAQQQKYEANYNLAKVFEEKAGIELTKKNGNNYQKVWLYTLAALNQDIGPTRHLPISFQRLSIPGIFNGKYRQIWTSPKSEGHSGVVYSLTFSPDGKRLTSKSGKEIYLWDVQSGKRLVKPEVNSDSVTSLAFNPDGKQPAAGSNKKIPAQLAVHSDDVSSIAFSPDGKWLAAGSKDKASTIRRWDVQSGKLLTRRLPYLNKTTKVTSITGLVFSPDGKHLAFGADDNSVYLSVVHDQGRLAKLEGHSGSITSLAFSPDGKRLASGSKDKSIRLWSVRKIRPYSIRNKEQSVKLEGHSGSITSLAFSPDGKRLAAGSGKEIYLWDVRSRKQLAKPEGHSNSIISLVFSPDGKRLVSGSNREIYLWDVRSGKQLAKPEVNLKGAWSMAFSSDGRRLAFGSDDKSVRLWDVQSGKHLATLEGHSRGVGIVAFSPDGKRLASASSYGAVYVWDVQSEKLLVKLEGHSRRVDIVVFSPDRKRLAAGFSYGAVYVWDVQSGKPPAKLKGHSGSITSLVFRPDGKRLASGSKDKTVHLWNAQNGDKLAKLEGHSSYIDRLVFSPDGKRLASADNDGVVYVWDAQKGKELASVGHSKQVTSVVFSPDGKRLASGSKDTTIWLLDLQKGEKLVKLEGHSGSITSMAFSPDGKRLASGSGDTTVRLWDVLSGKQLTKQESHSNYGLHQTYSPDGKWEAAAGRYGDVSVRDVQKGEHLATLKGGYRGYSSIAGFVFSPDGKRLAAGSRDKTICLWDVQSGKQLAKLAGDSGELTRLAFSPDGKRLAARWRAYMWMVGTVRWWDISYLDYIGTPGKRSPHFKKIYKAAYDISPYRLDGLKLVLKKPDEYKRSQHLLPPRPPDKTLAEWILENVK
jgi:WD40 repeat protein